MIASRNANIDSGNPKIKLVEIPATDLLKETALSHQSETKVWRRIYSVTNSSRNYSKMRFLPSQEWFICLGCVLFWMSEEYLWFTDKGLVQKVLTFWMQLVDLSIKFRDLIKTILVNVWSSLKLMFSGFLNLYVLLKEKRRKYGLKLK